MACDSLYCAWLKVHYPYELYVTMLKLYDEKKNTNKISSIIEEMKKYRNISLTAGRFGQDNRDWLVDKENGTISQSLSSIKNISKQAAKDLYKIKDQRFDTFTDLLRELQMNTSLKTNQIRILIELNYFRDFGCSGKLMKVYEKFFEGEQNLKNKNLKSYAARLAACRAFEGSLENESLSVSKRLNSELANVGLCLSSDRSAAPNLYFVKEVDDKYGVKAELYSIQRGASGTIRFRKPDYAKTPFQKGDTLELIEYNRRPHNVMKDGVWVAVPGEIDIWAKKYTVSSQQKQGE